MMTEQEIEIIEKAFDLFKRYGIKSVTMDDIAGQMGMSKKTLYKYFQNKKDLVHTIMRGKIEQSEKDCLGMCKVAKDPIHEIILIMQMLKNIFHNVNPMVLYDIQKYHHKTWKLMEDHQDEFIFNMMVDNLNRGIKAGLYRESLKVDIIVRMRLEVMRLSFTPVLNPDTKYSVEEIQISLLTHFLMGITTIKGHKLAEEYRKQLTGK